MSDLDRIYAAARASLHISRILAEKQGGATFDSWLEVAREGASYGFGYRDALGNVWEYRRDGRKRMTRTLVRPVGDMTPAEALMATHDRIMLGQNVTSPEERRFALDCKARALELGRIREAAE